MVSGTEAVKILLADFEAVAADIKGIIKLAQEEDEVTADCFISYLAIYEKKIWMLSADLK